ncbi:hypothetical protein Btru_021298 [Bulinus truncatus]|nr:hypothetical protein Btru_021298 [Bulinus truncatus]
MWHDKTPLPMLHDKTPLPMWHDKTPLPMWHDKTPLPMLHDKTPLPMWHNKTPLPMLHDKTPLPMWHDKTPLPMWHDKTPLPMLHDKTPLPMWHNKTPLPMLHDKTPLPMWHDKTPLPMLHDKTPLPMWHDKTPLPMLHDKTPLPIKYILNCLQWNNVSPPFCFFPYVYFRLFTQVSPESFDVGLTRNLTVECLVTRENNPNLAHLISISLHHSTEMNQSEYSYLASMNSFQSGAVQVEEKDKPNGRYFGKIDNNNKSFLRAIWEYPKVNRAGHYKCEASGITLMGKHLTLSSTATVQAVQPVKEQIVDKIQTLARLVEQLQTGMNATNNLVNELRIFKEWTSSRLNLSVSFPLIPSPRYQGRRYWLSKRTQSITPSVANLVCQVYGGYLVEIDSNEELRFVRDHLVRKRLFHTIHIGATDEKHEGVWINRHSGTRVTVFNWGPGEPNGGRNENCMEFRYYTNDWYMNDMPCSVTYSGYICEIPE